MKDAALRRLEHHATPLGPTMRTSFALCRCRPLRHRHCFFPGRMMIARCSERIRVGMDITGRIVEDDG